MCCPSDLIVDVAVYLFWPLLWNKMVELPACGVAVVVFWVRLCVDVGGRIVAVNLIATGLR